MAYPVSVFPESSLPVALRSYFQRRALRRLALYLAMMLPLVWGLVAVEQARFDALAEAGSNSALDNLSHAFGEEVRATVGMVDLSLVQLRSTWKHNRAGFGDSVAEHARHLGSRVPMHITVTDAAGRLLYTSAGAAAAGLGLGDLAPFRTHIEGQGDRLHVSRPVLCRITNTWAVLFTRPIHDAQGRLLGIIAASVAPDYFARFYDSIDLGPAASIGLLRADGALIARSTRGGGKRAMGAVLEGLPFQELSPVSGRFRQPSQIDGIDRYFAWRKLPEYELVVTVGQAVRDADARYAQQRAVITYAGAGISVVLGVLGWAAIGAAERRRRATRALAAAEARWKLALNASGDGVWDCDLGTGLATLSPRAQVILDTERAVIPWHEELDEIVHPEDVPDVRHALREHFAGRTPDYVAEHRVRMRNGDWSWIAVRGTVTERGDEGQPLRIVGTFSNIDARKVEEARMRRMAHEDALTGLPNRVLFGDRLRQAILTAGREGHKVGVIYFDLDRFKPVNDTYGHAVGDRLLRMVGQRVRAALRESDTLARIGGDEFVVLLPRCDEAADAERVAGNILARLSEPFDDGERVLQISCSLGFALYPDCGGDSEALLRSADLAMYDAKAHGRNRVSGRYRSRIG